MFQQHDTEIVLLECAITEEQICCPQRMTHWGEIGATSSDTESPFHSKSSKEVCAENAMLTQNGRFWGTIAVKNIVQQRALLSEGQRSVCFDCRGTKAPAQSLLWVKRPGDRDNQSAGQGRVAS